METGGTRTKDCLTLFHHHHPINEMRFPIFYTIGITFVILYMLASYAQRNDSHTYPPSPTPPPDTQIIVTSQGVVITNLPK